MSQDRLFTMANQIAAFFATQPGPDGAARVAAHLNDFWAPEMRAELARRHAAGTPGLTPLASEAVALIRLPQD